MTEKATSSAMGFHGVLSRTGGERRLIAKPAGFAVARAPDYAPVPRTSVLLQR